MDPFQPKKVLREQITEKNLHAALICPNLEPTYFSNFFNKPKNLTLYTQTYTHA
jgi:hypothetical protein